MRMILTSSERITVFGISLSLGNATKPDSLAALKAAVECSCEPARWPGPLQFNFSATTLPSI